MTKRPEIDPAALLRGMEFKRMTRRDMFRHAGVGAGTIGLGAFLAACGVKGQKSSSQAAAGFDWAAQKKTGIVNFTNWPQYIDKGKNGSIPTLDAFEKQTGDKVTYRTDIQDNATYYAQIRPELEAGQDIGSDIIVMTNGSELSEMMALNYLIPLDHSLTPNFNKYAGTTVKDPPYDPGNKFTMAWQSGFTGIGYNTKYVKNAPTSFMDLLDPAYKGKVGMMGNNQDLPCFALVATGVDPNSSTPAQWQKAADLLQQQKDSGNVRKYYLQDYLTAFENEETWITMAWSGDILIDKLYSGYPEFEFLVPDEGGVIWTDNMCIPQKAAHPLDAINLMDYYYEPSVAAKVTEYNNYVTPVPAGLDIVKTDAAKATGDQKKILEQVAGSIYVFPTDELAKRIFGYRVFESPEQEDQWNKIFQPIYQS